MKSHNPLIFFRGYTKRENGRWVAVCVDLNIAAQGETYEEATQKCHELVGEYLLYVKTKYSHSIKEYIPRLSGDDIMMEYYSILNRSIMSRSQTPTQRLQCFNIDMSSLTASLQSAH